MFSLIIVIIAIALVALLALAAHSYLGNTSLQGQAKAHAAAYINQGQQLLAATQAFHSNEMRLPNSINELVTAGYLRSIPEVIARNDAPRFELIASAYAQTAPRWDQAAPMTAIFWVRQSVDTEVCRAVNRQTRGDDGIYQKALPTLNVQCYGVSSPYTVLVAQPGLGPSIDNTLPPGEVSPPNETPPWAVPPSTSPTSPPPGDSEPSGAALSFSPVLVNFGSMPPGQEATATVFVTNRGTAPTNIAGVVPGVLAYTTDCIGTLAAGATCQVDLTFTFPASPGGVYSGTVTVQASTGSLVVPWVAGEVCSPEHWCGLQLDMEQYYSGYAGGTYGPFEGQLSNWTGTPQTIGTLHIYGADFEIVPYTDLGGQGLPACTVGMTLNDGESCGIAVRYVPQTAGDREGAVYAQTAQGKAAFVTLFGSAMPPATSLVLLDSTFVLDNEYGGLGSSNHYTRLPKSFNNNTVSTTLFLRNDGLLPATGLNISVPAPFTVQSSTCGTSLAAGAECSFVVAHTPGWYNGLRLRTLSVDWTNRSTPRPLRVYVFGSSLTAAAIDTTAPPSYSAVVLSWPNIEGDRPQVNVDGAVFGVSSGNARSFGISVPASTPYVTHTLYIEHLNGHPIRMGGTILTDGASAPYRFVGYYGNSTQYHINYAQGYWWDEVYRCTSGYFMSGRFCEERVWFTNPGTPGTYTTTLHLNLENEPTPPSHAITLTTTVQ